MYSIILCISLVVHCVFLRVYIRHTIVANFDNVLVKMFNEFKGCVCYMFDSLLCMSTRGHLWNKEKRFLFYFESSFRSGDNQILNFQMFKCHDLITCRRMKLKHILLNNLGNKRSLEMKFGQFMQHYKITFFIKNLYKKCGLDTSSRHFLILKNPL